MGKLPSVPIEVLLVILLYWFTVVQTWMGLTTLAATLSCNLWYEIPKCLFFSSDYRLVLYIIIPKLSPQSDVGPFMGTPKDLNIYLMSIASFVAIWPVQNSADYLDVLMVPYLLLDQIIGIKTTKHMTLDTDIRVTWSWAWSESNYTVVLRGRPRVWGIPSSISYDTLGYFSNQSEVLAPLPLISLISSLDITILLHLPVAFCK